MVPERDTEKSCRRKRGQLSFLSVAGYAIGGVIVGAVVGWGLGFMAGEFIGSLIGREFTAGHGVVFGALAGLIIVPLVGWQSARREARRAQAAEQAAVRLGLEYEPEADPALEAALRKVLPRFYSVRNVVRSEAGGPTFAVGDLCERWETGTGDNRSETERERTIAYLHAAQTELPDFALIPGSQDPTGLLEGAGSLVSKVTGAQVVELEGHPGFSRNYTLTPLRLNHRDWTRELFTGRLAEYFAGTPGLRITAESGHVVLFHEGLCRGGELASFASRALEAAQSLVEAAGTAPALLARDRVPGEAEAAVQAPGLAGALFKKYVVTPAQLESFLSEPPPREVPANIRRSHMLVSGGHSSCGLVGLGSLFALPGAGFVLVVLLQRDEFPPGERALPMGMGLTFAVVGACLVLFPLLGRRRKTRLLRDGIVTGGTVDDVGWEPGEQNERTYWLSFRFGANGSEHVGRWTHKATGAREPTLPEKGDSIRVLYDPADPRKCVWADGLSGAGAYGGPR